MASSLQRTRDFADFLANRDSTLSETLTYLVRVVFSDLNVDSAIFFQGNDTGEFMQVAYAGLSIEGKRELGSTYRFSMDLPAAIAIQTGDIIWLNPSSKKREQFPILHNFPTLTDQKTLIVIPVWVDKTPEAAIAIFSVDDIAENSDMAAFLTAISSIFALYHYRKIKVSWNEDPIHLSDEKNESESQVKNRELTERQLLILRLISEERTNQSISEFLGYSESTIRQEIVKIFDKLGCRHRSEAAAIYRSYY